MIPLSVTSSHATPLLQNLSKQLWIAAATASEYMMQSTTPGSWLSLFPAWNMLSAIMLIVGVRYGLVDEFCITDDNVNTPQVIAGVIVLFAGFAICHLLLKLHWSLTFSICVAFATAAGHAIREFTPGRISEAGGPEATTRL